MVDEYAQKLINSGYSIAQTRDIIVAGLKGYEKKLSLSRDKSSKKWRPLHAPACYNQQARRTVEQEAKRIQGGLRIVRMMMKTQKVTVTLSPPPLMQWAVVKTS